MRKLFSKINKKIRKLLLPTEHQRTLARWRKDDLDNSKRYRYDLNSESMVFDLGGYRGEWSYGIYDLYKCDIMVFEPIKSFYSSILDNIEGRIGIQAFEFGLSNKNEISPISLCDDSSSLFLDSGEMIDIQLCDIADFLEKKKIEKIDLMKINIEGGEYDLLERLLEIDFVRNISNLQIQFHELDDQSEIRMKKIQEGLSETHIITYQYKFVWENWQLKL